MVVGGEKLNRHLKDALNEFKSNTKVGNNPVLPHVGSNNPPVTGRLALRIRPQRITVTIAAISYSTGDHVGVSSTDDYQQEVGTSHPLDGAVDELKRASASYAFSLNALWSLWEARTATRMVWHEAFKLGTDDEWNRLKDGIVNTIGTNRTTFTTDGILLPLEVQDRMQWWTNGTPSPALADGVRLISTNPATTFRGTRDEREHAQASSTSTNTAPMFPSTVAELVAAHAEQ